MSSKLNQVSRAKNSKQQNAASNEDVPKKVVLDVASAALPQGRRLAETTATMNGIVSRVYEDEHHYHMVFKNCSSTKGNTTDDEERQRTGAAGTEFKLEKRDLYKERKEQEALERMAR